jgi:hypothetical protein
MGRPPSNGGPTFRFNQAEVGEMDAILQAHDNAMPARELLEALAEKFTNTPERSGKVTVQMKQVWNWFQNRRYAIRAKAARSPGSLPHTPREELSTITTFTQPTHSPSTPSVRSVSQAPQHLPPPLVPGVNKSSPDNSQMEFEAKSARDGAWYDVASFLSHRYLETGDPEVLVRFAGFGQEEDEWVNIRKLVRQRSLPCESSECVAVLPGDLILCFQEGKEQALYFDAHVLDAQRRRHDVRGCRCRFLVRYDHDLSEEIVPLRKVCRRPETDYRLQQLHAVNELKQGTDPAIGNSLRVYPPPAEGSHGNNKQQPKTEVVGPTAPKDIVAQVVSATPSVPMDTNVDVSPDKLVEPPENVAPVSGGIAGEEMQQG